MPTVVENLQAQIEGWSAQLATDAAHPYGLPDYSIDGQTVSRAQWRESLLRNIKQNLELIQMLEPFELRGRTT